MTWREQRYSARRLRDGSGVTGRSSVKKHQVLLSRWVGFVLILVLGIVPTLTATDPSPIVGNWEGTLDPGAQPTKRIVVRISAAQDGNLSGTIDYPDESLRVR